MKYLDRKLPGWEFYAASVLLYLFPLAVLFINSLNGPNVAAALHGSFQQFFSFGPGLVNWLLVLALDMLIGLYARPIIAVYRRKLRGQESSACQVDHAMKHLNHLPQKLVFMSVCLFVAAAAVRVLLEHQIPENGVGLGFVSSLADSLGEALVSGVLAGVVLAINFDNILFRVRSTIVNLNSRVPMQYSSMYGKVFMVLFAIVLYVIFITFSSMGGFFALGVKNPALMLDPGGVLLMTGPQMLLQSDNFIGLREMADVFGLKIGLFGLIVLHLLWQIKQMFSHPIRTVSRHLHLLNGPYADSAAEIAILQNDEYAPIYREINKLIARQQGRLEISEKRLEGIIRNAPDPIVAFDAQHIIRVFNPAAEQALEYRADDIVGKPLELLLAGSGIDLLASHSDGVAQLEWTCRHGQRMLMESHLSEAGAGSDDWTTLILRDITAQAELEATLKRARQEAETASRMKSEFLANMSHELRTPLNAILGFTQLMSGDKNLTDAQKERIRVISRSGEHLLSLINDILDISKIEAGKMELHNSVFDLHEFVGDLRDMFALKCQGKGLALYMDTLENLPRHVEGDLGKLRQVMINLLGNAVKFTDEGGISILVGKEDGRIRFAIQDSGRGIPENEHHHILQPFIQASSSDHEGGTGLGLAISRHYIELMGGQLSLVSQPGKGSTFSFDLALPEAAEAISASATEDLQITLAGDKAVTALIVDDQLTNRLVLKELLEKVGFQIIEAVNGREAVERAIETRPAIVFMDIKMPVLDGYGAVKLLKENPQTAALKVFALTASAFTHDEKKIVAAGFDGFLAKPFKTGQLYHLILEKSGLELQVRHADAADTDGLAQSLNPDSLDYATISRKLAAEELTQLKDCVSIGDYAGLAELAEKLAVGLPDFGALLLSAARNFDETLATRLLQKLEGAKHE
ncbi:MAG: response regulator [Spirochaetes bacterium]|nr:response regulator [Spirochaetota bacterium]